LTRADQAICGFAQQARAAGGGEALAGLHALLRALHTEITEGSVPSEAAATAAEVFARRRGGARDSTHLFIAAAHSLGIPARYVAGYFCTGGATAPQGDHAWAEAFVPDLGWVGFDPATGACPTDAYVRVAIGLDGLGAASIRGKRYGFGEETVKIAVRMDQ
jgi:transglutaminase-like putative cysteine protease